MSTRLSRDYTVQHYNLTILTTKIEFPNWYGNFATNLQIFAASKLKFATSYFRSNKYLKWGGQLSVTITPVLYYNCFNTRKDEFLDKF